MTGQALDGATVTFPEPGRPAMVLFLAHWCPHCQVEIQDTRDWVAAGNLPDDVDLVGVATYIDPVRPNHPPSEWFVDEGWHHPTIADADETIARAYGLTQFPYWVIVDADGQVVDRRAGTQTEAQFEEMLAIAQDG
jgi:cytochrome c biogenesis protein CcmG, thiol:disulfide interchange protein DsbE